MDNIRIDRFGDQIDPVRRHHKRGRQKANGDIEKNTADKIDQNKFKGEEYAGNQNSRMNAFAPELETSRYDQRKKGPARHQLALNSAPDPGLFDNMARFGQPPGRVISHLDAGDRQNKQGEKGYKEASRQFSNYPPLTYFQSLFFWDFRPNNTAFAVLKTIRISRTILT
jgi:hypothetical protein